MVDKETKKSLKKYWKKGYKDKKIGSKIGYSTRYTCDIRNKMDLPFIRPNDTIKSPNHFNKGEMERGMITVLHILKDGNSHPKKDLKKKLTYMPNNIDYFIKLLRYNNFITKTINGYKWTPEGFDFYTEHDDWVYHKQIEDIEKPIKVPDSKSVDRANLKSAIYQ